MDVKIKGLRLAAAAEDDEGSPMPGGEVLESTVDPSAPSVDTGSTTKLSAKRQKPQGEVSSGGAPEKAVECKVI